VAVNFGGGKLLYEIRIPREYGGNIKEYSVYQGEDELVFPPFTSFRVDSAQKGKGGFEWYISLTCLGITATPQTSSPEIVIKEKVKVKEKPALKKAKEAKKAAFEAVSEGNGLFFLFNKGLGGAGKEIGEGMNESGESLLFVTAKTPGSEVAMKWLVEKGADVNVKNEKDDKTPLHAADRVEQ